MLCPLRTFAKNACGARSRKSRANHSRHVSPPSRLPPSSTRYTPISRLLRLRKQLRPKPHVLHGRGSRRANCGRHIARSHRPCEGRHSARSHSPCEGRPRHVATCTAGHAGIHNAGPAWAVWVEQRPCADLDFAIQALRDSERAQKNFAESAQQRCRGYKQHGLLLHARAAAPPPRQCSSLAGSERGVAGPGRWGSHLCSALGPALAPTTPPSGGLRMTHGRGK